MKKRVGFTLIEVLIAAGLFVLVFSFAVIMLQRSFLSAVNYENFISSTYLLQSKMEELKACSFADIQSNENDVFASGEGKIEVVEISPDLLQINVRMKGLKALSTFRSRF